MYMKNNTNNKDILASLDKQERMISNKTTTYTYKKRAPTTKKNKKRGASNSFESNKSALNDYNAAEAVESISDYRILDNSQNNRGDSLLCSNIYLVNQNKKSDLINKRKIRQIEKKERQARKNGTKSRYIVPTTAPIPLEVVKGVDLYKDEKETLLSINQLFNDSNKSEGRIVQTSDIDSNGSTSRIVESRVIKYGELEKPRCLQDAQPAPNTICHYDAKKVESLPVSPLRCEYVIPKSEGRIKIIPSTLYSNSNSDDNTFCFRTTFYKDSTSDKNFMSNNRASYSNTTGTSSRVYNDVFGTSENEYFSRDLNTFTSYLEKKERCESLFDNEEFLNSIPRIYVDKFPDIEMPDKNRYAPSYNKYVNTQENNLFSSNKAFFKDDTVYDNDWHNRNKRYDEVFRGRSKSIQNLFHPSYNDSRSLNRNDFYENNDYYNFPAYSHNDYNRYAFHYDQRAFRSRSENCIDPRFFYKNTEITNKENIPKPSLSYAQIITKALSESREGKLSLGEIYSWIETNFEYYKYANPVWKNSIRHNLSLSKCFKKVPRDPGSRGKGGKWMLERNYLVQEDFKRKKRSFDYENDEFTNAKSKNRLLNSDSQSNSLYYTPKQN